MTRITRVVCLILVFFLLTGFCPSAQAHVRQMSRAGEVSSLTVYAFPSRPLLPAGSEQELFIAVLDQDLKPLEGVLIGVVINFPDGQQEYYRPSPTDANGISKFGFTMPQVTPREIIPIEVMTSYQGIEGHTSTWFRAWW